MAAPESYPLFPNLIHIVDPCYLAQVQVEPPALQVDATIAILTPLHQQSFGEQKDWALIADPMIGHIMVPAFKDGLV